MLRELFQPLQDVCSTENSESVSAMQTTRSSHTYSSQWANKTETLIQCVRIRLA